MVCQTTNYHKVALVLWISKKLTMKTFLHSAAKGNKYMILHLTNTQEFIDPKRKQEDIQIIQPSCRCLEKWFIISMIHIKFLLKQLSEVFQAPLRLLTLAEKSVKYRHWRGIPWSFYSSEYQMTLWNKDCNSISQGFD